jgi:hypothetical protein
MQTPLMESRIQSSGKLRSRYLPALYLDPSFFARYVSAAGAAEAPSESSESASAAEETPRVAAFAEIARRTRDGSFGLTPVVSSITLLRWMQEMAPGYRAADREGRHSGGLEDPDFSGLRYQGWLRTHLGGALDGVLQVDLQGFALTVEAAWEEVPGLALADGSGLCALHALAARHLGCTHLATLLPEMERVCALLRAAGGPEPLLGARAVLEAAPPPPG